MKKVLFLCTGNFYRSRLAMLLFNHYAGKIGLDWQAESRGFAPQKEARGLSPMALRHLDASELSHLADHDRHPLLLSVDELPSADLVILLNRSEHMPMMQKKFAWMIQALEKDNKLRAWNIYDLPVETSRLARLLGLSAPVSSQPADSATEHVDFAVRSLVAELASGD